MYCSNCGKKVSENDNFCRHCSYLFGKDSGTSTVVQTGNHNTVIGAGEHSKTEVVYGDKVISGLNPQVIKLTACTDIETPVNSFWSILLSAIGLAASLITVLSSFFEGTKEILKGTSKNASWMVKDDRIGHSHRFGGKINSAFRGISPLGNGDSAVKEDIWYAPSHTAYAQPTIPRRCNPTKRRML